MVHSGMNGDGKGIKNEGVNNEGVNNEGVNNEGVNNEGIKNGNGAVADVVADVAAGVDVENSHLNGGGRTSHESVDNDTNRSDDSRDDTGSDDDDEYLLSDEEIVESDSEHMNYHGTLSERSNYLSSTLSHALDSLDLDKSLVLQAKLSGSLNNETQKLDEKKDVLREKIRNLQLLYDKNFVPHTDELGRKSSVVQRLHLDLKDIERRIHTLKNGKQGLFKKTEGIITKFPVEYNQSRDKVLERQLDD